MYDVVIIGAGPAGSAAALEAAKQGAKTIFIEEHPVIGIPTHCTGGFSSVSRPDLAEEILQSMSKHVVVREPIENPELRAFSPSGKLIQVTKQKGTYFIDRAVFDYELARQAVNAGAELLLNTRVTGLIKQGGRTIGVTTSSSKIPQIASKVVIAADGITGGVKGVAKWEGLIRPGQTYVTGIAMEMARVTGFELAGEMHTGAIFYKGWLNIFPTGSASCKTNFMSLEEFERVKTGESLLSGKLKDAIPIRIVGWTHTSDLGVRFPEIVREGLILTGSAANWRGTLISVISGRCAGKVAAEAARENDVSINRLGKFIDLYEETGLLNDRNQHSSWLDSRPFRQLSDEEIDRRLTEMIAKTGMTYIPAAPVTGLHGRVD